MAQTGRLAKEGNILEATGKWANDSVAGELQTDGASKIWDSETEPLLFIQSLKNF